MKYENLEELTLDNGLRVYILQDHDLPKILGAVMVHAGAKHDPPEAAGVAHYFEHILFKGTDRIGTWDYAQEKPWLDQIEQLYDDLAKVDNDDEERQRIQKEINRCSIEAAQYAIANDLDHILKTIGSTNVNAYTSFDHTVYHNTIPSGQLQAWLEIYAERFRNPVFRLFQSELETVYEEKNRLLDDPMRALTSECVMPALFKKHPYGSHSIIGSTQALKNPSLSAMRRFFETYYVANNMSLFLCGDIDLSQAIPWINQSFGILPRGEIPCFSPEAEPPLEPQIIDLKATPYTMGFIAFRTVPSADDDFPLIELCHRMLVNDDTGLLDEHTHQNDWVSAFAFPMNFCDYGHSLMGFIPKNGVSFSNCEQWIFEALERLKKGMFSPTLFESQKKSKEVSTMMALEKLDSRAQLLMSAVGQGKRWSDVCQRVQQIRHYTVEDIQRVAQTYFNTDHALIFRSNVGKPPFERIDKPDFAPISPSSTQLTSPFSQYLERFTSQQTPIRFIDFQNDLSIEEHQNGLWRLFACPNPVNDLFSLEICFHYDRNLDPRLPILSDFLNNVGSQDLVFTLFRQALQRMGADAFWQLGRHEFSLLISGFEEDLDRILSLVSNWVIAPSIDASQIQKVCEDTMVNHRQLLQTPQMISEALMERIIYGQQSSFLTQLPLRDMKKLTPESLISILSNIRQYGGHIEYCGKRTGADLWETLSASGIVSNSKDAPEPRQYRPCLNHPMRQLFLMDNQQCIQNQIGVYFPIGILSPTERVIALAFNHYFGMGMTSLVFQEIREFRSLAYGALVYVNQSEDGAFELPSMCIGELQTQADKTQETIEVLEQLFDEMPLKPERWPTIQTHLLQSSATLRPNFRNIGHRVATLWYIGYREDSAQLRKQVLETMTFDDIVKFYRKHIQNQPRHYTIYGNCHTLSDTFKARLGQTQILKTKDVVSL